MPSFVLQYNRKTRDLQVDAFEGPEGHRAALLRRFELEEEAVDSPLEIVVLNADSLDTLRITHSRYFDNTILKRL